MKTNPTEDKRRRAFMERVGRHWCRTFGVDSVHLGTLKTLAAYARESGTREVKRWITLAKENGCQAGCNYADQGTGRYVSGIRRREKERE
jgi:hypothetical protein